MAESPSERRPPPGNEVLVLDRETGSAAETEALGRAVGVELGHGSGAGTIWLFSGDLGAGKTVFVRGICRGLGVGGRVRSPGFTLVTRYAARMPIVHVDLYRLEEPAEVERLGWEELYGPETLLLVEWGERARASVGPDYLAIELRDLGGGRRRIRITAHGRTAALGRALEPVLGGVAC
jgi:tRNA threonylcarbamoyladenosine biosynthesis protein TsaE